MKKRKVETIPVEELNPLPDRKALDNIIFYALGLTEKEHKEVYWHLPNLSKQN